MTAPRSLPWRLGYLCGYDRELCADIIGAFVEEVMRSLRRRAKRLFGLKSVEEAHTGAVTFVQRFDSALRLNVHDGSKSPPSPTISPGCSPATA